MTRTQAGLLLLAAIPALWALMWWGWRGRLRRQRDLPALPLAPGDVRPELGGPFEGIYVCTTTAGDWLDRIAVHHLGERSGATVTASRQGLLVGRQGAPDLWIPAGAVSGVRRQRGMAGKFVDARGLVVLTWTHAGASLDTGLRLRSGADREALVDAVHALEAGAR